MESALEVLQMMEQGKTVTAFHQKCVRLDGKVIDMEMNQIQAFGLKDDTVMVVGRDITELKKDQEV